MCACECVYGQEVKSDYEKLGRELYRRILDWDTPGRGDISESDVDCLQVAVHSLFNCATAEFAQEHLEVLCT